MPRDLLKYTEFSRRLAMVVGLYLKRSEEADRRGHRAESRLWMRAALMLSREFPEVELGITLLARDLDLAARERESTR